MSRSRANQERAAQPGTFAADRRSDDELRRHLRHVTTLLEVNTRIASAIEPDGVLADMLGALDQLVTYGSAAVYLLDLAATPARSLSGGERSHGLPQLRAGRTYAGGPLQMAEGTPADETSAVAAAMRGMRSVSRPRGEQGLSLAVPLRAGGRALGALELQLSVPLSAAEVQVLELLATAAAVALQNVHRYQQIQRLATTDPLTGLSNYRHFHELLDLEVRRACRLGYPVGVLMMDLDHFKRVNDHHGHPVGDATLRLVAEVLRGRVRRTDVLARLGGEEFGAVLPGASPGEVAAAAEKLRQAVEQLPPLAGGTDPAPTRVTLSIGGASLPAAVADPELLVSRADRALYRAKRDGRNRVRLWAQDEP